MLVNKSGLQNKSIVDWLSCRINVLGIPLLIWANVNAGQLVLCCAEPTPITLTAVFCSSFPLFLALSLVSLPHSLAMSLLTPQLKHLIFLWSQLLSWFFKSFGWPLFTNDTTSPPSREMGPPRDDSWQDRVWDTSAYVLEPLQNWDETWSCLEVSLFNGLGPHYTAKA